MSDPRTPHEPSTQEIIASISRMIAEDGGVREPILPAVAPRDDILELTEALDEDGSVRRLAPAAASIGPAAAPPETAARTVLRSETATEQGGDRILSEAASEAAAAAFARLDARPRGRPGEGELPVGGGRTLEDIVRDALRPLLQSWLEQHLPAIVERLVREEIARVAGKAGTAGLC